jgi:hypothetical protein
MGVAFSRAMVNDQRVLSYIGYITRVYQTAIAILNETTRGYLWFNVGTMIPAIANMGEAPYMIDIETSRDDHGLYCKNNGRINVVIPIP